MTAEHAEQTEMFPGRGAAAWAGPEVPRRCGMRGDRGAWVAIRGTPLPIRRPVCNRTAGHEGEHRVYGRAADILARWP